LGRGFISYFDVAGPVILMFGRTEDTTDA
jgi:hypothetical protein